MLKFNTKQIYFLFKNRKIINNIENKQISLNKKIVNYLVFIIVASQNYNGK